VTSVPPGAGDSEGAIVMASPGLNRSVSSRHERGEQRRHHVFAAASEDADRLEGVEAHRQQVGKGACIP
jgi:hypothetical protein